MSNWTRQNPAILKLTYQDFSSKKISFESVIPHTKVLSPHIPQVPEKVMFLAQKIQAVIESSK